MQELETVGGNGGQMNLGVRLAVIRGLHAATQALSTLVFLTSYSPLITYFFFRQKMSVIVAQNTGKTKSLLIDLVT